MPLIFLRKVEYDIETSKHKIKKPALKGITIPIL
jgi:hypothetical protein